MLHSGYVLTSLHSSSFVVQCIFIPGSAYFQRRRPQFIQYNHQLIAYLPVNIQDIL